MTKPPAARKTDPAARAVFASAAKPPATRRRARTPRVTVRVGNRGAVPEVVKEAVRQLADFLTDRHPPARPLAISVRSVPALPWAPEGNSVAYWGPPTNVINVAGLAPARRVSHGGVPWGTALDTFRLAILREFVHADRYTRGRTFRSEIGVTVRVRALLADFHASVKTAHAGTPGVRVADMTATTSGPTFTDSGVR